jgi:selenocysteine lyase/cysteine desulfurase
MIHQAIAQDSGRADPAAACAPDWDALRKQFPAAGKFVYMDISRKAILPLWVDAAIRAWLDDVHQNAGAQAFDMEGIEAARADVGATFGAPPRNLAFIKNTSEGMNIIAEGYGLQAGDNVLISDFEHENNTFPWRHLSRRGIEVRRALPDSTGRVTVDCYRPLADGRTRIISAAWVAYGNGYRSDLPALSEFCRGRGIRLVVDAIQALGVLSTPLAELGADAVVAGGHKAQFSLAGAGLMYMSDDMMGRVTPSYAAKFSFASNDRRREVLELAADAHRFEYGNPNFLGIWVQRHSARKLAEIGLAHIERRVQELTTSLADAALARGLTLATPLPWRERAGIVSFVVPGDAGRIVEALRHRNIICSAKDGYVRCALHFYNTSDELGVFLDALTDLLRRKV